MNKLILTLAAVLIPGVASAQFQNTQDAYTTCQTKERIDALRVSGGIPTNDDLLAGIECVFYLQGLADGTFDSLRIEDRGEIYFYIMKGEPTVHQVMAVFQRYVRAHPESLDKPARDTLLAALVDSGLVNRMRWPDSPTTKER